MLADEHVVIHFGSHSSLPFPRINGYSLCRQEREGEAAETDGTEEDPAARHPGHFTSAGTFSRTRRVIGRVARCFPCVGRLPR